MFKKLLFPFTLALVAALALAGVAYAAARPANTPDESSAAQKLRAGLGQITALGDSQFTVQLKNGGEKVIRVDADTRYVKADGSAGSFADLQVDLWAAGRVVSTAVGPLAHLVILMPAGFDPARKDVTARGAVTAIGADSFTLHTLRGEDLTFAVDGNTQFFGQVHSLADLQPAMLAAVAAQQLGDGSYLAVRVTARAKPQVDVKAAGRVTAIDAASFTIRARDGNTYTFQVTSETRFRSRGGVVKGLRDLRLGMGVGVAARDLGDGQLQALVVIARARKAIP